MIATFMRRALTHMLARLGAPNPEVLAVFHPPGTLRLVTPLEQAALHASTDARPHRPTPPYSGAQAV